MSKCKYYIDFEVQPGARIYHEICSVTRSKCINCISGSRVNIELAEKNKKKFSTSDEIKAVDAFFKEVKKKQEFLKNFNETQDVLRRIDNGQK